jgi:hypothetical protein
MLVRALLIATVPTLASSVNGIDVTNKVNTKQNLPQF